MSNKMVRVFVKRVRTIAHLTFRQQQMLKLGTVGLAAVKNRVQAGQNIDDGPAKPLTKRYAIWKTKKMARAGVLKGRVKRDLTYTGDMLRNLQVRTVSSTKAMARNTTVKDRQKAENNQRIQPWMLYSAENQRTVLRAAQVITAENIRNLVK